MKKAIDNLIKIICVLSSYIYTLELHNTLINIKHKINTYWFYRRFHSLGDKVQIFTNRILGAEHISIGSGTTIGYGAILAAHSKYHKQRFTPSITIGENAYIGDDSNISCINEIRIGNGVLLGRRVMINDNSHGNNVMEESDTRPSLRPLVSKGKIIIEDNVWIGEMVCILGKVHIGRNAIVGAGSVVTTDVPAHAIVAGIPARIIKYIK